MKKLFFFAVFALCALLLVSCNGEVDEKLFEEKCTVTFHFDNLDFYSYYFDEEKSQKVPIVLEQGSTEKGTYQLEVKKGDTLSIQFYWFDSWENGTVDCFSTADKEDEDKITDLLSTTPITKDLDVYCSGGCIIEGSLVALANGQTKLIEDIEIGDKILTWDFFEGKLVENTVVFIDKTEARPIDVLTITTECGASVRMTFAQSFFDADNLKVVQINFLNYKKMIGKNILVLDGEVVKASKIVSIEKTRETVACYDLITVYSFNFFAGEILTYYPGILAELPYMVDENFKYDEEDIQSARSNFGLLTYDEVSDYVSTEEYFDIFRLEDVRVQIGRGLYNWDYFLYAISEFKENRDY